MQQFFSALQDFNVKLQKAKNFIKNEWKCEKNCQIRVILGFIWVFFEEKPIFEALQRVQTFSEF